jgi:hypothetical protein
MIDMAMTIDQQFFLFLICLDRKYISLQILEEDSYEKDVLFYLEIDEPRQLGGKSFFYSFIYSIHISLLIKDKQWNDYYLPSVTTANMNIL